MSGFDIPIRVVERETGLSKEVLRKWEARYRFPAPMRDSHGQRLFSADQLQALRSIKRLLDAGMRVSQAVSLDEAGRLKALASIGRTTFPAVADHSAQEVLQALQREDPLAVRQILSREQMRRGMENLVVDVVAPLTREVGEAWADGRIKIRHEHLYAEAVQDVLRVGMYGFPQPDARPSIVLATPPGELHTLGLLMVQALLSLHGARCVSLGAQVPIAQLAEAAQAAKADVVGISFSLAYPMRGIAPYLDNLRRCLPSSTALWAGGDGVARLKRVDDGIVRTTTLAAAVAEMRRLCGE